MTTKHTTCDICGADITDADFRYHFKEREDTRLTQDCFEWFKWRRMDMCAECYDEFKRYIVGKKLKSKR